MRDAHLGEQLRMFMKPAEILEQYDLSDGDRKSVRIAPGRTRPETNTDILNRKYMDAVNTGLRDEIVQRGVEKPIEIAASVDSTYYEQDQLHPFVINGHHRLAVAAKDKPDSYIPVRHHPHNPDIDSVDW